MKFIILFISLSTIYWTNCEGENQYFVNIQVAPGFKVDRFSIEGHQEQPQEIQVPVQQNPNPGLPNNGPLASTALPETTILPTTPALSAAVAASIDAKIKTEKKSVEETEERSVKEGTEEEA